MTVTELVQHLESGRKVKTERGEFVLDDDYVKYRGRCYADFDETASHLSALLDEIGEGVWVEEPEPLVKILPMEWRDSPFLPGFQHRVVHVKTEHVEAFEKHVEAFGREG